jgi:uncharacterized protein with HEPN domain
MSERSGDRRPARSWYFFLDDMAAFAKDVLRYTAGMDQTQFESNGLVLDATLRKLELIGEAARNVPEEIRGLAPEIPWRQIIATRNRIVHAYLGIDNDTIWSILRDDLPGLIDAVEALKQILASEGMLPRSG